jgi:hypothetical protein
MKLISASRTQFLFLALTMFLLAIGAALIHFWPWIDDYYWSAYGGAEIRRDLGFATGYVKAVWNREGEITVPAITGVTPGGVFAKAGARPGMMPASWCKYGIDLAGFYQALELSRAGTFPLRLVPVGDCQQVWQGSLQTVVIHVPAR